MVRNVRPLLRLGARGAFGRLVFVSSGGTIYGRADRHPTPEDTPHRPISSYGAGNLAVERLLFVHAERHGLDVRVARVANPYGPFQSGRRGQGVVAALLLHGLRGTPFPLMGDGAMVRDYVAVGDVVEALAMLAAHRGAHRVFNVGSGVGLSLRDLIGRVETVLERPIPIDPRPARALDVPVSILDVSRARAELGWAPRTPLDDGLRRTALWLSRTEGACWPPRRLSATHGLE
jgi:UDP-glucose 4-epimerase